MATVTITETVFIAQTPEVVWDFTQDYSKRHLWDKTILSAVVIQQNPRKIAIKGIGRLSAELLYKLDERPRKTSLAMMNIKSPFIIGGGGSWNYEAKDGGTLWTQTNSLVLKNNFLSFLMRPLIQGMLKTNTRQAMQLAKRIIAYGH